MLADINGNLADLRSEAMASQRFCLRWNNHQSNLLSVFDQLLHDEAFVDVTLAVEGQLLRAHKMVLSACSPYFQALFVGHPDKHPIVILKDVPYVDMRSLLDFMYRGEVSVDQERLTAFLRVAESLRIKGLTEVNEDKCDLPSITSSLLSNQNAVPPPPPNLHRINQSGGQHHHVPQKRFHHLSSHPLLGSALTAPKRKRGRPRKLSGSSDTPLDSSMSQDHQMLGSDLVQGSPEMMEMKMGLDFQSELTSGNGNSSSNNISAAANLATASRKDEPVENGTDDSTRVKREPEPTPSTSAQATDESFTQPLSRQASESFKQDDLANLPSDTTFEICDPTKEEDNIDTDRESLSPLQKDHLCMKPEQVILSDGIHFLTTQRHLRAEYMDDEYEELMISDQQRSDKLEEDSLSESSSKQEISKQLLEYLIQNDGTVVCKWCGEILPSRTRWYRHKYKLHVRGHQMSHPAQLFKCRSCNIFFKSRKGYVGHLSSRHNDDNENDENKDESSNRKNCRKSVIIKGPDWDQQREKEEKLVAEIIDRVKRECEAQGETVTRRGYSRRTTVMNS